MAARLLHGLAVFLSTPSARRATKRHHTGSTSGKYFYPRPPRGGRPYLLPWQRRGLCISIHALREEGDWSNWLPWWNSPYFYPRPPRGGRPICRRIYHTSVEFLSTPSARRATIQFFVPFRFYAISIHALREEGDIRARASWYSSSHFYPRPPRGGRLKPVQCQLHLSIFLSTPSARRATMTPLGLQKALSISIHALREEGDCSCG